MQSLPLHDFSGPHPPQFFVAPQALVMVPQELAGQVGSGQTHWLLWQTSEFVQPPQETLRALPQLSTPEALPHSTLWAAQKAALDWGVQQALLAQTSPPLQPPQETVREVPQRSVTVRVPQAAPCSAQS